MEFLDTLLGERRFARSRRSQKHVQSLGFSTLYLGKTGEDKKDITDFFVKKTHIDSFGLKNLGDSLTRSECKNSEKGIKARFVDF